MKRKRYGNKKIVKINECSRCGWRWIPKSPNRRPKVCPKCKSIYWDDY